MENYTFCIITGCTLQLQHDERFGVAGDLHLQGDRFIFAGNMSHDRSAEFVDIQKLSHYGKRLIIPVGHDYFERRGVFVMKASMRLLNAAARHYVGNDQGVPA